MAEAPTPEEPRTPVPHAGGQDLLTQALEGATVPYHGMTGHPAAAEQDDGLLPEDGVIPERQPPEEPRTDPEPRPLKYASHEEAERAAAEAQQRMTEETQRRAALERELEVERQRSAALEQERQARPASPPEPTRPPFDVKAHLEQAYQKMAELDPMSPDFETQQQGVFVDALASAFTQLADTTRLTDEQINAKIQTGIREARTADEQARTAAQARQTSEARIRGKFAALGIDITPPTDDDPLGGQYYHEATYLIERGLYPADADEDAAVQHVAGVIATRHGVALRTPETGSPPSPNGARPASSSTPPTSTQRAQTLNTPMERSGMGRSSSHAATDDDMDARPMSMDEMLQRSLGVRRP